MGGRLEVVCRGDADSWSRAEKWMERAWVDVFGLPQNPKVIRMAGAKFSCVGIGRAPSAPDDYALRKTDALAERYLQLADDFQDARILE